MKCPRCTKDATLVGVESFGERFQCRFCTNEWNEVLDSTVIPPVPPERRYQDEIEQVKDSDGNSVVVWKSRADSRARLNDIVLDRAAGGPQAVFNKGARAMLGELDAYLVDQLNALSDRMRLASDHDDFERLQGGRAHLAITLDLVRALKKRY